MDTKVPNCLKCKQHHPLSTDGGLFNQSPRLNDYFKEFFLLRNAKKINEELAVRCTFDEKKSFVKAGQFLKFV